MGIVNEHEYTTYPRRFVAYRWYKPLLVGLLACVFSLVFNIVLLNLITKALFGTTENSSGYDDMDLFSPAGAFYNGVSAASIIPCLLLAALIVKDRPVSSYWSSMGGWRWKAFLKSFAAAFVILGIPSIVYHFVLGRTGDIQFTAGGFIVLTLLIPFQGIGEELAYRGCFMQTVSSWFMIPAAGVIVQILVFTAVHPYNAIGRIEIAVSALLYALVCVFTRGIEAGSALHIINNVSEIYMAGIGFGNISSEQTVVGVTFNLFFKILFFFFIIYAARKLNWFDKVKYDDVAEFNAKWLK